MTAPQPATPGSDSVHAQIAEVLAAHDWVWDEIQDERRCACGVDAYEGMEVHHADVLVPLVDRLRAEAKAEEAQRIYQAVDDECQVAEPPNYEEDNYAAGYLAGLGFAADFIGTPGARSDAYRINPSEEQS